MRASLARGRPPGIHRAPHRPPPDQARYQLIETIRSNPSGSRAATFSWQARGGSWTLTAGLNSPGAGKDRKIVLLAKATVTPQGNSVTEVVRMIIEGRELSKEDLLKFFKLYKAGMSEDGRR